MSDYELRCAVESIRACPFGCGWEARRKIKPGIWTTFESLLPVFIERCRSDVAVHLVVSHGAREKAA